VWMFLIFFHKLDSLPALAQWQSMAWELFVM
jgi:hypothetical protein